MLLVRVTTLEGVLSQHEKRVLVDALTNAVVAVEGEHVRKLTWVLVEELGSGACGIGGQVLTSNDVRALAAGAVL